MQTDALLVCCDTFHIIAKISSSTVVNVFNLMEVIQLPNVSGFIQAALQHATADKSSLLVYTLHFTTVAALFESISVMAVQCNNQDIFLMVRWL